MGAKLRNSIIAGLFAILSTPSSAQEKTDLHAINDVVQQALKGNGGKNLTSILSDAPLTNALNTQLKQETLSETMSKVSSVLAPLQPATSAAINQALAPLESAKIPESINSAISSALGPIDGKALQSIPKSEGTQLKIPKL